MAKEKCRGCEGEVDSWAKMCPHCGRPSPTKKTFGLVMDEIWRYLILIAILQAIG